MLALINWERLQRSQEWNHKQLLICPEARNHYFPLKGLIHWIVIRYLVIQKLKPHQNILYLITNWPLGNRGIINLWLPTDRWVGFFTILTSKNVRKFVCKENARFARENTVFPRASRANKKPGWNSTAQGVPAKPRTPQNPHISGSVAVSVDPAKPLNTC